MKRKKLLGQSPPFFAEHIANPLHAVLDGTLDGTSPQTQPKARERTHPGQTHSPYADSDIITPMQAINHNLFVTRQPYNLPRSNNLTFQPIAEIAG